jgi:hypothetical protein
MTGAASAAAVLAVKAIADIVFSSINPLVAGLEVEHSPHDNVEKI